MTFMEFVQALIPWVIRGLAVLGLALIGNMISLAVSRAIHRALNLAPKSDPAVTRFIAGLIRAAILAVVALAVLSFLGIETTSLSGMILASGIAIAFVLQGPLANLAAGAMMLFFRPFSVGDEIEVQGIKGIVTDIEMTATRMKTRDNVAIIIPNGQIWGQVLRNHSAYGVRRLDMVFGVSYDADIDVAMTAIANAAAADARVHTDPAPWTKVVNLGDSSVDIELRVWCHYDDYRGLKASLSQPVKAELDAAGIGIPYPHLIKIRQAVPNSKAWNRINKLAKIRDQNSVHNSAKNI